MLSGPWPEIQSLSTLTPERHSLQVMAVCPTASVLQRQRNQATDCLSGQGDLYIITAKVTGTLRGGHPMPGVLHFDCKPNHICSWNRLLHLSQEFGHRGPPCPHWSTYTAQQLTNCHGARTTCVQGYTGRTHAIGSYGRDIAT